MADGSWTPAFPGQRPPFQPGHELSTKHGAYAELRLSERSAELVPFLETLVPAFRPSDGPMVRLLALGLTRLMAAAAAIDGAEPEELQRLRQDERGWANTCARIMDQLGMSPTARARLGLDVALTQRAVTLTGLHADAAAEVVEGAATEEPP